MDLSQSLLWLQNHQTRFRDVQNDHSFSILKPAARSFAICIASGMTLNHVDYTPIG